ncbi:3-dehydroquinate synthase, partial [Alcanivorax sp. HI0044]|uniref:3-dehydroquinate synthase family protein n=2 Tax=Alcanivorax TaxID=59753 RepID=UPI000A9074A0
PDFYQWLETNNSKLLSREESVISEAIFRSCENKAQVVADDETEQGNRALLNLGHTFGHAIETATGYSQWLHGEAVAVGMLMAIRMSAELGWVPDDLEPGVVALLSTWGLPVAAPKDMTPEQFVDLMAMDKKVHNGQLRLVLLRALGKAVVTADYDEVALQKTLEAFCGA